MGRAYTYRCDKCGYEDHFNEGHGFLIHPMSLDSYLESGTILFHHKTNSVIEKLAKEHKNLFIDAGFKIFKCPDCNLLYDKIEVTVYDDGKILHKSEFRCTQCRARLKLTNIHRLKKAVCPKCKQYSFRLDQRKQVLWD
ncbi:MAG: hypothetical protein PHN68_07355 [Prolixibacteraceae bacterium]|jgi:predicted RNA-binding Zn-ribbon protein involved in translation (DUF1610 family)|nr:hypothetical protein [Prolixibacteraceae bacterium]MDD4755505.1 hypothetical protein [Prolixibacteraceae bacterium]NLO01968.1 hypothetical protein [Bacteroidales bacterium]